MRNEILKETKVSLFGLDAHQNKNITRLSLSSYFTVLQLDNGHVGACMSYYALTSKELKQHHKEIENAVLSDPLLLNFLQECSWEEPLKVALEWAVLSALSAPFLMTSEGSGFVACDRSPYDLLQGAERVVVIGFGGYLEYCSEREIIKIIDVFDLSYDARCSEMNRWVQSKLEKYPSKRITINPGSGVLEAIKACDVCFITGSALSNGSMEDLLDSAVECPFTVVQGQSASTLPNALFKRGVDLVVTTIKPPQLMEFALEGKADIILEKSEYPNRFLYPR